MFKVFFSVLRFRNFSSTNQKTLSLSQKKPPKTDLHLISRAKIATKICSFVLLKHTILFH